MLQTGRTLSTRFDTEKAIQCAGVVLRDKGYVDLIRFLKILYIANRETIRETGVPLLGGRLSALEHGPLHSQVYDLVKGLGPDEEWHRHFELDVHRIRVRPESGEIERGALSRLELRKLQEAEEFASRFGTWELSEETHEFEEWVRNQPAKGSSKPIPLEDVYAAVDYSEEQTRQLLAEQRSHEGVDALLASAGA